MRRPCFLDDHVLDKINPVGEKQYNVKTLHIPYIWISFFLLFRYKMYVNYVQMIFIRQLNSHVEYNKDRL